MKKAIVALVLACLITVILAAPVMAEGPGNNGQGADPGYGPHPPNDVWVPDAAFNHRGAGDGDPPNPNSNGAIFHQTHVPGQG